jgi:hypothetical protein
VARPQSVSGSARSLIGFCETAPRYASFLEKVVKPMRASATATTPRHPGGVSSSRELLWTLRFRVRDGSLVPLEGPTDRRLPDQLRVRRLLDEGGSSPSGCARLVADVT